MVRAAWTACLLVAATYAVCAQQPFSAGVDLVHFGVSVVDKQGKPVTGLKAEDFEIVENGKKQSLQFFSVGNPEDAPPLHLGLLLDTSGSMADDLERRPLRRGEVRQCHRSGGRLHRWWTSTPKYGSRASGRADYPRLVERIRMRKPDGWTALYDAIGVYLNGAQNQDGQKVLVLYTDGGDTRSSLTFARCARPAEGVGRDRLRHRLHGTPVEQRPLAAAQRARTLRGVTGGQAYFPGSKDLDGVFDRIRKELAARYSLGYLSSDTRTDGAWRGVEIKLVRQRSERCPPSDAVRLFRSVQRKRRTLVLVVRLGGPTRRTVNAPRGRHCQPR